MALGTQMKMMRAVREILLGDGRNALPKGNDPKPDFAGEGSCVFLPRSTPEAEGLPSAQLESFYRDIAAAHRANPHALLVLRHGKVVSEGYFAPFRRDVWHITHSLCKTVTGTAVGIAVHEGLFALEDPVYKFFPQEAGLLPSRRIRSITVRHLLTMSSGISFNEISEAVETNWLRGIFSSPVSFEPGSQFVYNSMNSYLLAALVCRASGEACLVDYLHPRLFQPMGFGQVAWEKSPEGIEKGGWGMYMLAEDMAKLGQLYLQGGRWQVDGQMRQLLSEDWVSEATRVQIDAGNGEAYGYQMWVDPEHKTYIMSGMFGQYVTVMPDKDIVIVLTSGNPRLLARSVAYSLMTDSCFARMDSLPHSLPESPRALQSLHRTLENLQFLQVPPKESALPARQPRANSSTQRRQARWAAARSLQLGALPPGLAPFMGTTWHFGQNRGGILPIIVQAMNNNFTGGVKAIRLDVLDGKPILFWEEGKGTLSLPLGFSQPESLRIRVGRESFVAACRASLRPNEDGCPVLTVEVCLLEHSSFRLIKLMLQDDKLLLRLDEEPQFSIAIEATMNQSAATATQKSGEPPKPNAFSDIMRGSTYMSHRVEQLCTPSLVGIPVSPEDIPADNSEYSLEE